MALPRNVERKVLEQAGALVASVLLPPPPSTNHLYLSVIRWPKKGKPFVHRVPTAEYETWKERADPIVRTLRSPVAYPVVLRFTLVGKWERRRDGSNAVKATEDALVRCGVIANDNLNHVVGGPWYFEPSEAAPQIRVEIEAAPNLFGG